MDLDVQLLSRFVKDGQDLDRCQTNFNTAWTGTGQTLYVDRDWTGFGFLVQSLSGPSLARSTTPEPLIDIYFARHKMKVNKM